MSGQRRAGIVLGYANIATKNLVNLVYTPMLLAFVGQADYGVYQTANSFVFSLTLLSFGLSGAYVRFYTQKKAKGSEESIRQLNGMFLLLYVIVSVAALALGFAFSANVGAFFSKGFAPDQVALAGILMAIMAVNVSVTLFSTVFDSYILACEQFKFQQSRQLLATLSMPGIAFLLLNLGFGTVGVAIAQLLVSLALLALNVRFSVCKLGMRFCFRRFDGMLFKDVVVFGVWVFANQVCELVNQSVPNVLLGVFSSASTVAVFAVSVQIRQVFYSLSTTISNVFVPLVNRIVAVSNDNAALTELMTRVGRYQAVLFVYVYGGFALLGQFFIVGWAGEDFRDAYWLILAMSGPLIIPLTQNVGIEIQRAKNRHKARSVAYLAMAAVNLVLTAVLAEPFGYWAPVIGYVSYILIGCGLFMNWYYQARIGLDMARFWGCVVPVILTGVSATAICLLAKIALPIDSWGLFFAWGVLYSVLYAVAIWFFVANDEERKKIADKFLGFRAHP